jgi:fumarate hydratase subunit beta
MIVSACETSGDVYSVVVPYSKKDALNMRCGQKILFSGSLITGRDAAHMRLLAMLQNGEELPIELAGQLIYYTGPCPAPQGKVIGSAGPTTSGRMDFATPALLDVGLGGMLGKGKRSEKVREAVMRNSAPYFITYGGAGAFLASKIQKVELLAFAELGAEAMFRFHVIDFPAIVAIDVLGNDIYAEIEGN